MATDLENQMHKALTQPAAYRYLRADLFFRLANYYRYFSQTHEIINLNYILYDFTEKKTKQMAIHGISGIIVHTSHS